MSEGTIVHVAGAVVSYSRIDLDAKIKTIRQRCAWCGALLIEYEGPPLPFPEGLEPPLTTWENYTMLRVDGPNITPVEREEFPNGKITLPLDSCFLIDQTVTQ